MQLHPEQVVRTLLNESFHSRRMVVAMFVVVNAGMLAAGLLWPKGYSASTTIFIDEKNIIQPLMQGAAVTTEVTDRGRNAREVILGRKIMDRILEHGGWLKVSLTAEEQERLIEQIKKRTTVTLLGKSIIRIEYRDDDPERVYRTTQKFADLFIQESIAAKAEESSAAFEFIGKQTDVYQDRLNRTEEELKNLRSSNLEARVGSDAEVNTRLNELQSRIERTNQELREAEIKGLALDRQVSGEAEVTSVVSREGQFRTRIGELQSRLDTLRLAYHDTHPDVVQIKQHIQDLTEELNTQRERRVQAKAEGRRPGPDEFAMNNPIYQQLRREQSQNQIVIESLKARIAEAQRQLNEEISRGKRVHSGDARLAELTRDYQVDREIYQDLLRRRERARVSMNLDSDRQGLSFKIQEPAVLPVNPTGLQFSHFMAGGLLFGILIPLAILFARLHVDPRIRVGNAISTALKVPVAAVIPHFWTLRELKSLRAEQFLLVLVVAATIAASATLALLRVLKVL